MLGVWSYCTLRACLGTDKILVSNLAPKHARKHEAHPHRVKKEKEKEFRVDSNDFGFI